MNVLAVLLGVLACASVGLGSIQLTVVAYYPAAKLGHGDTLTLRGSACGLSWSTGIATVFSPSNNSWSATLSCAAGTTQLQLKALVNDQTWQIGANTLVNIAGSNAASASFYPWFFTDKGTYGYVRNVYSPQLKNTRNLVVYTPPSYSENSLKRYANVLIMQGMRLACAGPLAVLPPLAELALRTPRCLSLASPCVAAALAQMGRICSMPRRPLPGLPGSCRMPRI